MDKPWTRQLDLSGYLLLGVYSFSHAYYGPLYLICEEYLPVPQCPSVRNKREDKGLKRQSHPQPISGRSKQLRFPQPRAARPRQDGGPASSSIRPILFQQSPNYMHDWVEVCRIQTTLVSHKPVTSSYQKAVSLPLLSLGLVWNGHLSSNKRHPHLHAGASLRS